MKSSWWGLLLVFFLVFALRLLFAFQSPFLSDGSSYLVVRSAESIINTGLPLFFDPLGYGGRAFVHSPMVDYVVALFGFFFPVELSVKVVFNLLASLLVFPLFFACFQITGRFWPSLLCSVVGSFVPHFFSGTINHASSLGVSVVLFFCLLYAWLRVPDRLWVSLFVAGIVVFSFLHPLSVVFALSLVVYVVLMRLEGLKQSVAELELCVFSLFLSLCVQFVIYKDVIASKGFSIFWQNVPSVLRGGVFSDLSVLGLIWTIGVLPLVCGIYVLYRWVQHPSRDVCLLFSCSSVVFLLLWLKVLPVGVGLMLLGALLVVALSVWISLAWDYLHRTKVSSHESLFVLGLVLVLVFTSILPAFTEAQKVLSGTIDDEYVEAFSWLSSLPDSSVVVSPLSFGHYVAFFGGKKSMMDDYFLSSRSIDERYDDLNRIYRTLLETELIELLSEYGVTHVFVPHNVRSSLFDSHKCLSKVFDKRIRIYVRDSSCRVRVVG